MIPDRDIWQAALLMVRRYGDDAMLATPQMERCAASM
jgi:hypothetical protein